MAMANENGDYSLPQVRPGVDVQMMSEPVCEIDGAKRFGYLFDISIRHSLLAIIDEEDELAIIYRHKVVGDNHSLGLEVVKQIQLDLDKFDYCEQVKFDAHGNIVVTIIGFPEILRYNINGKRLSNLPPHPGGSNWVCGLACGPNDKVYISVSSEWLDGQRIYRLDPGAVGWRLIYRPLRNDEIRDENDRLDQYSIKRFGPGHLAFGPDGNLYVAAVNCIVVMNPDNGTVIRQIGVQEHRGGVMTQIVTLFVTGDGMLFVCDDSAQVLLFRIEDGSLVGLAFSGVALMEPTCMGVDTKGYVYILDIGMGKLLVF